MSGYTNLIKPISSDHDLIELAKRLHVHLDDILAIEEIKKPLKSGSYVILLRNGEGVGHWVAIHNGEYFDSTGIGPPTVLGNLPYNQRQYQGTYEEFCGPWCIFWLYTKQKNRLDLLKAFTNLDIDFI